MSITVDTVSYTAGNTLIVNGVSLSVEKGRVLGLLGPNGSGKSSLLRLICRLRKVQSGVITLGENDVASISRAELARRVAFVEQQSNTDTQLTVLDVVKLGRTPHRGLWANWTADDEFAVEEALLRVDMLERAEQFWQTLSGGERQRVHIARALAQTPSELLLDEPTNHLDIQHQLEILSLVSKLGITSIVALHDLNLAAMFCDSLAVLQKGEVVAAGTPEDVLTEDLIGRVFGVRAHIQKSPVHGRCNIQYLMR
ncbi:ABC transporter ATP-binding protein [Neorhizobium alkalisoli]|uniref:Iron complex transport system ATP-binding protein n=1 Tax=Neorhizobium alkalisoli TaxID=528178 RepID=A0A561QPN2_9HYPH|nr:ABC transporter ATP-binding protein [Neorhizobium alkalisoli]TWF52310.1 iron complex transport system ATP-binding protein [Neorhizobium alkalisoli]